MYSQQPFNERRKGEIPFTELVRLTMCLYKRLPYAITSFISDIKLKQDIFCLTCEDDTKQVHHRRKGRDFLISIWQPYVYKYGEITAKWGRDMVKTFSSIITLITVDEPVLFEIPRIVAHNRVDNLIKEFIKATRGNFGPSNQFWSKEQPNVMLSLHHDNKSGIPKVTGYFPPANFDPAKGEIIYYPVDLNLTNVKVIEQLKRTKINNVA